MNAELWTVDHTPNSPRQLRMSPSPTNGEPTDAYSNPEGIRRRLNAFFTHMGIDPAPHHLIMLDDRPYMLNREQGVKRGDRGHSFICLTENIRF